MYSCSFIKSLLEKEAQDTLESLLKHSWNTDSVGILPNNSNLQQNYENKNNNKMNKVK